MTDPEIREWLGLPADHDTNPRIIDALRHIAKPVTAQDHLHAFSIFLQCVGPL